MKDLFRHKYEAGQADLNELGYALFDCLGINEVNELIKLYKQNTLETYEGFHPTMFHKDAVYRKKMNDIIRKTLEPKLKLFFNDDYHILYGNYMVKEPGESSFMKIHQDWTYVDESEHKSFAVWIPLVDLNEHNGAFTVIPQSHKLIHDKRGPGTYCPLFRHFKVLSTNYSKPLYLKAGQAVCWDHRLAHYSPANLSTVPRIAVTAIIVPKNIPIYHYYKEDDKDTIETYHANTSFFMNYEIGKRPNLMKIDEKKYMFNDRSLSSIVSILKQQGKNE